MGIEEMLLERAQKKGEKRGEKRERERSAKKFVASLLKNTDFTNKKLHLLQMLALNLGNR